jgi:hypothetical protein
MTHFEYLAVSFSIVLSFAAVRLLGGMSDVFARSRVHWVHAAWVAHQLLFVAYVWWIVWSYRDVSWNFFRFAAVLAAVSLVYYQAATLVPPQTGSVASWREYLHSVRVQFFGAVIVWSVVILFNTAYILNVPALHSSRVGQMVTLAVGIVGVATDRAAIHRMLIVIIILLWPIRVLLAIAPSSLSAS